MNEEITEINNLPSDKDYCTDSYILQFLERHIGKWMCIEFLVGNELVKRVGQLMKTGNGYIVLRSFTPTATLLCDAKSIKFATIIYDTDFRKLL